MTLREIAADLGLELLSGSMDTEISGGYTSDLLSDVMAHADEGCALITIQAHTNTVAVASHADLPAIIVCNERPVSEDMLAAAVENRITICRTTLTQFQASGKLFARL
jgi:hypothetical protein